MTVTLARIWREDEGILTFEWILLVTLLAIGIIGGIATVRDAISILKEGGISQLPVVDGGKLRGIVAEVDLLRHLVSGKKTLESPVGEIAEGDYATVTPDTKIELLQSALADAKVAMVTENDELVGIIAKIDLIDFLARAGQS